MVSGGALGLKDAPTAAPGSAQPRQVQAKGESIREARDISGQGEWRTLWSNRKEQGILRKQILFS